MLRLRHLLLAALTALLDSLRVTRDAAGARVQGLLADGKR